MSQFTIPSKHDTEADSCCSGFRPSQFIRTKKSYYSAMGIIMKSCPNFAPESVMLDFEIAEHSAIKKLFPGTDLRGYFFHWKQCLICKFKTVKGYPRDPTVRENVHCLFGVACVPETDVPGCWDVLRQIPWNKSTDFRPVLRYMETEWIKNTTFPVQTWNDYNSTLDNDPRTNNYSED